MVAMGAVVVAGTVGVVFLQSTVFPPRPEGSTPHYPPHVVSEMAAGAEHYEGTVLQLAELAGVSTDQMRDGQLLFGNLPRGAGVQGVGAYTGIGFLEFSDELCMDYRGATCPDAFDRLWDRTGEGVPVPLIDAMRVSTLVIQRSSLPEAARADPPPGWRVAERTDVRTVWVRDEPLTDEGRVSWASDGVQIEDDVSQPRREEVRYTAAEPGRLLFARLAWPGYTATVDGRAVEVTDGPAGLVAVDVPAGSGTLVLQHASPGLALGTAAAAAAGLVALAQSVLWLVQWRRSRVRRAVPEDIAHAE
jgi:hypothetical protein